MNRTVHNKRDEAFLAEKKSLRTPENTARIQEVPTFSKSKSVKQLSQQLGLKQTSNLVNI